MLAGAFTEWPQWGATSAAEGRTVLAFTGAVTERAAAYKVIRDGKDEETFSLTRPQFFLLVKFPVGMFSSWSRMWMTVQEQGGDQVGSQRKRPTRAEKEKVAATGECYVCADLGLDHAGFTGYDLKDIAFDHVQDPFGNVGVAGGETLPIHAATGGATADDTGYETSTSRNCHRLRSNNFSSRAAYVAAVRARMQARTANFIDDIYGNGDRNPKDAKYSLPVGWTDTEAEFIGKKYSVISESRNGLEWRRFLTTLRPDRVFTDHMSQVRPATRKTLHKMLHTFQVDGFPMFAPVNARVDACGHVVLFDGNHRATAHALAFGVEEPMPVMIWDIEAGAGCALGSEGE